MLAAAFNMYQNILLKQVTKDKKFSLVVVNHPLPKLPDQVVSDNLYLSG